MKTIYLTLIAGTMLCACAQDQSASLGPDPSGGATTTGQGGNSTTNGQGGASSGQGGSSSSGDMGLGYENGTRLRARVHVGADGSREFLGWYDTQRNENCSFRKGEDGTLRCLPEAARSVDYLPNTNCAVPIYYSAGATCLLPEYIEFPVDFCGGDLRIHKIGMPIGKPNQISKNLGGGCSTSNNNTSTGQYYDVGPPIPASEFVAAVEQVE